MALHRVQVLIWHWRQKHMHLLNTEDMLFPKMFGLFVWMLCVIEWG